MARKIYGSLFFFIAAVISAQQEAAVTDNAEFSVTQTGHYEIYAAAGDGEILARQMEERFTLYNQLFHFDPALLARPLRVRAFENQDQYDSYVISQTGTIQPGAVYLHYDQTGRRELVVCPDSDEAEQALPYQAFIQFLRAFVSNPPAWIREGFAAFFGTEVFDEEERLFFRENLTWLGIVKSIQEPPPPVAIMTADAAELPEHFQGLAWSLVSFFLNSEKDNYIRSMTDSFVLLSDSKTAEENADVVMKRIVTWNNIDDLTEDYLDYLGSRKSFGELIEEGQLAYTDGKPGAAKAAFQNALELQSGHYAPWYYLGLLAYESGNWDTAEQYYYAALERGADTALVLYALGLNAAVAGKNGEAVEFLRRSAGADPARYGEKARALILRLE